MSTLESSTSIITAIGAVATAVLVYIAVENMKQDHERSRRENAISLIREVTRSIKPNHFPCLDFMSAISQKAAEDIFSKRTGPLQLPADQGAKSYLKLCLPPNLYSTETDLASHTLSYNSKSYISSEITFLLNTLEYVSSSWRYGTASGKIIHEQFGEILLSDKLSTVVSYLKMTRHKNSYPSLFYIVDNKKILAPNPSAPELGKL